MFSLRQKISVGFGGLLIFLLLSGGMSILLLNKYSTALEKIFRENYNSVIYGQKMKEAIYEIQDHVATNQPSSKVNAQLLDKFFTNLSAELQNITLEGEGELARILQSKWLKYSANIGMFYEKNTATERAVIFKNDLTPESLEIEILAQKIVDINLANIVSTDGQVKANTEFAKSMLITLSLSGIALALLFTFLIARAILQPIATLTESAREIEKGNLDLTIQIASKDELGQLAHAFNAMALKLREFRRTDRAKLFRTQRTTQLALNCFPDAVAIIGLDGKIDLCNEAAKERFKLTPGTDLLRLESKFLWDIFQKSFVTMLPVEPKGYAEAIQIFDQGNEKFFLPKAIPILDEEKSLIGITLVLADVTDLRRLDEMKSGLLSVASHELKTPLTSIRMATHLLLEERIGSLNPKQTELVLTAREDAERLFDIIESLLDMGRIQAGRALLKFEAVSVQSLIDEALQSHLGSYRDKGVKLIFSNLPEDLPKVFVDQSRIWHVFSNLLSNALKFTKRGGEVNISGIEVEKFVKITVKDTGSGISAENKLRVFERFFKIADSNNEKGAGLGLAISKDIVEALGGTLWLEKSVENQGSEFCFTIPIVEILSPEKTS